MEPVLNKFEIADLLKAITEGRVTLDPEEDGRARILSCTPINILKLGRPDRRQLGIPNFGIILDNFSQMNGRSLTNQLQRTSSITRTALETFQLKKFMADRPATGAIAVLDMAPLKHGAMILIDAMLAFSMLEMMLGASGNLDSPRLERKLTPIELNILKTIIVDACNDLNRAFSPLVRLNSALIKLENNSRPVSIIEPEAEVIVGTFVIKTGECSGEVYMIFPFASIEPLRQPLADLLTVPTVSKNIWHDILENQVLDAPAAITAQSGTITLAVKKLLQLKKGDILPIDYDPNGPVTILVEDQPKFTAIPGTHNGVKAISLTTVI